MTFESFDWKRVNLPLEQRQNLEAAYNEALNFAKSPDGWLVFWVLTAAERHIWRQRLLITVISWENHRCSS